MKRFGAVIAVSVMLIIAGCGGSADQPDAVGSENTEPESGGVFDAPPPQNPWEANNITVQIVEQPGQRNYVPLVKSAIDYWNSNMSRVGWEGQFVYDSGASDPDVPVRIVDDVGICGASYSDDTIGCAPIYEQTGQAVGDNDVVKVQSRLNDSSTVAVTVHELGHTLGLTHDDAANWSIMNETTAVATVQQPNASERVNPFADDTVDVYYNDTANRLNDYIIGEFDAVWNYYNDGESEIVPSNVTFRRTETKADADIEIRLVENLDGGVSTVQWLGYDPDADGAIETYSTATVIIDEEVNQDNMAWHTGSWTTYLFSSQEEGALPDELTTRDADTRRRWPS
jgi:hypothetical protein